MTNQCKPGENAKPQLTLRATVESFCKSILWLATAALMLAGTSDARDLPDAPSAVMTPVAFTVESTSRPPASTALETNPIDAKFASLALVATGSTFADSYTTLFARQNWLAGKKGVCNVEVQSAYLYGTHPTIVRAYAVASAKSVGSVVAAYYLRKHHSRLWSVPLLANSIISLQGVTQNMVECN